MWFILISKHIKCLQDIIEVVQGEEVHGEEVVHGEVHGEEVVQGEEEVIEEVLIKMNLKLKIIY